MYIKVSRSFQDLQCYYRTESSRKSDCVYYFKDLLSQNIYPFWSFHRAVDMNKYFIFTFLYWI